MTPDELSAKIANINVTWCCRFHPVDWWHEVGCPHQEWSKEQLIEALVEKKKFNQVMAEERFSTLK